MGEGSVSGLMAMCLWIMWVCSICDAETSKERMTSKIEIIRIIDQKIPHIWCIGHHQPAIPSLSFADLPPFLLILYYSNIQLWPSQRALIYSILLFPPSTCDIIPYSTCFHKKCRSTIPVIKIWNIPHTHVTKTFPRLHNLTHSKK